MSHTPGPWTFTKGSERHIQAPHAGVPLYGGDLFCDEQYYPWCSNNDADWALIAAAPDLLAALKYALSEDSGFACPTATEDRMRAAVAKAEGLE